MSTHVLWVAAYGVLALVFTAAVLVAAHRLRGGFVVRDAPVGWAVLAGALWPMMCIGVVQFAIVSAAKRCAVNAPRLERSMAT